MSWCDIVGGHIASSDSFRKCPNAPTSTVLSYDTFFPLLIPEVVDFSVIFPSSGLRKSS